MAPLNFFKLGYRKRRGKTVKYVPQQPIQPINAAPSPQLHSIIAGHGFSHDIKPSRSDFLYAARIAPHFGAVRARI
jgi:hypothetical protein